jgi:ankyrin repeat protein
MGVLPLDPIKEIIKVSDVNYTARADGNTALHLAVLYHKKEIIKLLLEHNKLNLLIPNSQGLTVLNIAQHNKADNEVAERLQRKVEKQSSSDKYKEILENDFEKQLNPDILAEIQDPYIQALLGEINIGSVQLNM